MKGGGILLAAALLSVPLAQAQPARDVRRPASGTAIVSGSVVSDDAEPKPVRHARVTCSAPELSHGLTAITDDRGRFTCADLPPGRYSIAVTRDGWVGAAYGAKRPLRPGAPIPIGDGQRADVTIRLSRGAVITGALLDESGQPAAGATVVALRASMQNGERRLTAAGTVATADDRGVYRIFGLPPGDYYVGAGPSSTALSVSEAQLTTDADVRHARAGVSSVPPVERHVAFSSTYFPGTTIAQQAAPIPLRAGEERTDVDFALQLVPTARVEGTLTMPDGTPAPAAAQVTLVASGATAFAGSDFDSVKTTRPGADGTFTFGGVAPGTYTLLARLASHVVLWASTEVSVAGETISGLTLPLQPGLSIAGQVSIEGSGARPPFSLSAITITAEPVQSAGEVSIAPAPVRADAEGRFVVTGITPGRYRLVATLPAASRTSGWLQRSGLMNGIETLDLPAAIAGQSITGAVVALTDRPARVTGVLRGDAAHAAGDYTVVFFPLDPALRLPRTRRIQAVRAGTDGGYAFDVVAHGEYLIVSLDDVEPGRVVRCGVSCARGGRRPTRHRPRRLIRRLGCEGRHRTVIGDREVLRTHYGCAERTGRVASTLAFRRDVYVTDMAVRAVHSAGSSDTQPITAPTNQPMRADACRTPVHACAKARIRNTACEAFAPGMQLNSTMAEQRLPLPSCPLFL